MNTQERYNAIRAAREYLKETEREDKEVYLLLLLLVMLGALCVGTIIGLYW